MFVAIVTDFEQNSTSWFELLDKNIFWKYLLNLLKYLNLPTVVNSSEVLVLQIMSAVAM